MSKGKAPQFVLEDVVRPNILALTPYRCARDDFSEGILLDANENALGHSLPPVASRSLSNGHTNGNGAVQEGTDEFDALELHRYPSPTHIPIKERICKLRNVPSPDNVFLGVGSDEVIDLLFRIVCRPGKDSVVVCPPTYGMYSVCAQVNDVDVVKIDLDTATFRPRVQQINEYLSEHGDSVKLVFLCSPGNPTGTLIPLDDIRAILSNLDYKGLVVVDEAYIDFAPSPNDDSAVSLLVNEGWPNLVVMQTLSKGFGLAAIRCGLAISSAPIVQILNNVKAPYNISSPTASLALRALSDEGLAKFRVSIETLISNRSALAKAVLDVPNVLRILGTNDANFLLVQIGNRETGKPDNKLAKGVYEKMAKEDKVVVRFRGNEVGCEGCLRITVGTEDECRIVIDKMTALLSS